MKKLYTILLLLNLALFAKAQDAHLSQFYDSHIVLNPATTGMFDDDYRAHLQYRNQWSSVSANPFATALVSFEKPYKRFGFGLLVMNSKAGVGNLNVTNVTLSGAYEVTNDPMDEHHLTTGIQIGLIQKNLKSSNLVYNNQYTGAADLPYDNNITSFESYASESFLLPDFNFGIHYENTSLIKKVKPYAGISAFHLTSPKESYLETENKLPIKIVSIIGAKIKMKNGDFIEPNFLFMKQKNVHEFSLGFLWNKYMEESDAHLFFGPYYRAKDAVEFHVGALYKNYRLGLSYDINTSSLVSASSNRGGFEISLTYKPSLGTLVPSIY